MGPAGAHEPKHLTSTLGMFAFIARKQYLVIAPHRLAGAPAVSHWHLIRRTTPAHYAPEVRRNVLLVRRLTDLCYLLLVAAAMLLVGA